MIKDRRKKNEGNHLSDVFTWKNDGNLISSFHSVPPSSHRLCDGLNCFSRAITFKYSFDLLNFLESSRDARDLYQDPFIAALQTPFKYISDALISSIKL